MRIRPNPTCYTLTLRQESGNNRMARWHDSRTGQCVLLPCELIMMFEVRDGSVVLISMVRRNLHIFFFYPDALVYNVLIVIYTNGISPPYYSLVQQ